MIFRKCFDILSLHIYILQEDYLSLSSQHTTRYMKDTRYSKNNTEGTICLLCESGVANRLKDLLNNVYVWNLRRDENPPTIDSKDRVLREAADRNEYRGVITHLDASGGRISHESSRVATFTINTSRTEFSNLKVGTKVSFNLEEDERAVNVVTEEDVFASLSEYVSERDSTLEWSCVLSQVNDKKVTLPLESAENNEKNSTTLARALRNLRERIGIWLDPEMCTRQYQGWLRSNLRQIGRMGLTKDLIPLYRDTISRPEVRVYYILLPPSESILISPFSSSEQDNNVRVTFLKSVPDASKRFKYVDTSSSSSSSSSKYMRPRKRRVEVKKKKIVPKTINNNNTQQTKKIIPGAIWTNTQDPSGIPIYRNNKTGESVVKTLPHPWQSKGWTLMMNRKGTMLYWWNRNTNQSVWRSGENSMKPPGV